MRDWLERNGQAIQAFAALVTMLVAMAALVGVKLQIDANAQQQREQSARDMYREFLNLSIGKPEFAAPDYCAMQTGPELTAYKNYVEYMLYAADQLLSVSSDWEPTMTEHMLEHSEYLCSEDDWSDDSDAVQSLISRFRAAQCQAYAPACGAP